MAFRALISTSRQLQHNHHGHHSGHSQNQLYIPPTLPNTGFWEREIPPCHEEQYTQDQCKVPDLLGGLVAQLKLPKDRGSTAEAAAFPPLPPTGSLLPCPALKWAREEHTRPEGRQKKTGKRQNCEVNPAQAPAELGNHRDLWLSNRTRRQPGLTLN